MSFDDRWLESAIAATADRAPTGLNGSAALMIGKTTLVTILVKDGRIVAESAGDGVDAPGCQMPFTKVQAEAFANGEMKLAVEYMRGDFKATGSTAAIIAAIDALDSINNKS